MSTEIDALKIRPYEPRDREAVRTICCDTADSGRPVENFFPDREVFGDVLTKYYTDYEPESSWVGEMGNEVVGYITGCLDTRRFIRAMSFLILPRVAVKAIRLHTLRDPRAKQFFLSNIGLWLFYASRNTVDYRDYPSHLHVNLKPGFRAQGFGGKLVARFLDQAKVRRSCGVHANVREDSVRARNFFERLGFVALGRHAVMKNPNVPGEVIHAIQYGKKW
jgi:ribosomal protein S18 acetylase RimI-like enzyme